MDKTGEIKEGKTPCEVCGSPSVIINNGRAVCVLHNVSNDRPYTQPDGAEKVAEVLKQD